MSRAKYDSILDSFEKKRAAGLMTDNAHEDEALRRIFALARIGARCAEPTEDEVERVADGFASYANPEGNPDCMCAECMPHRARAALSALAKEPG